ncbi:MAG TPA: DUF2231 domain-containing protein [Candidatus Binataceae bacterium]|nr:DUF2231 domain-containing protein [Candidatus Binataceae bacterium]
MQSIIEYLKIWQPHPFVDHFTVALILLGIVTDLIASLFSARLWIRYMALTLMILGAIGAGGSNVSGGWEAHRVWDSVSGPGKAVLERHAWWGDVLPWVFGVLALWRIGVQFIGFIAVSRPIYLLAALIGGALIVYQGHLGSVMVYDYGIGTALLTPSQATPSPVPSPAVVAPEIPSESGSPSPALSSPLPSTTPTSPSTELPAMPTPSTTSTPVPSPTATPESPASGGAPISPPVAESPGPAVSPTPAVSPSPASGGVKNL